MKSPGLIALGKLQYLTLNKVVSVD